jgi:hypothetical protein
MSHLFERHIVRCPYHLAQRYLADNVAGRATSGESSVLTLTVSGPGLELAKDVVVTFGHGSDPMHFDEPWRLHWKPQSGPYPEFAGELTVRADETYESSLLELRGSYRPPGGTFGAAFDWAAGSRIAAATARALLQRIGNEMESRYRHDEEAKHSPTAS